MMIQTLFSDGEKITQFHTGQACSYAITKAKNSPQGEMTSALKHFSADLESALEGIWGMLLAGDMEAWIELPNGQILCLPLTKNVSADSESRVATLPPSGGFFESIQTNSDTNSDISSKKQIHHQAK